MCAGDRRVLFFCLLVGAFVIPWHAAASGADPALVFERISIEQGLSQSIVEGIGKDAPSYAETFVTEGIRALGSMSPFSM